MTFHAKRVASSDNMEKICVGRYCALANKKVEQLYKVSTPCLADHQFVEKKKNWKRLEYCQKLAL